MKRMLLFCLLTCITLLAKSQIINGVGVIKLGMTISEIKEQFPDIKESDDFNKGITKTFILSKYIPVDGHYIDDFYLSFYNDSLYAMYTINQTNIYEAFKIKYGEPKIEHNTTPKEYINGLGNTIIKEDESFKFEWNTGNPDIICYYNDQVKHDSSGKPTRYVSFGIENQKIFQEVKAILTNENEKQQKEEKEKLLKKLESL